ncbi:MAG: YfiR family protein [Candidatus Saccharibacteria bacterium]|nr:YfiR family protein [Moraxellaceae bacterium]
MRDGHPSTPINLCIVAAKHSNLLEHLDTTNNTANKIVVTKQSYDIAILSTQCDVIYFGDISPAEQQKVIAARQNRSILTISESDSDCAMGSSFCLKTATSPITFLVNLDSLARSGVRVDPNVLMLGRKKRATQ